MQNSTHESVIDGWAAGYMFKFLNGIPNVVYCYGPEGTAIMPYEFWELLYTITQRKTWDDAWGKK